MDSSLPHIPHFAFRIDQKDLPVNVKALLDDDFLVEFFFGALATSHSHSLSIFSPESQGS
jgi:hypothetical protein